LLLSFLLSPRSRSPVSLSVVLLFFFLLILRPLRSTLFPYTTLFRSGLRRRWAWSGSSLLGGAVGESCECGPGVRGGAGEPAALVVGDGHLSDSGGDQDGADERVVGGLVALEQPQVAGAEAVGAGGHGVAGWGAVVGAGPLGGGVGGAKLCGHRVLTSRWCGGAG